MNIPWYNYLFMLCIGIGFTYAGIIQKRKRAKVLSNGIKAEGVVTELVEGGSTKNSSVYYPVIRFQTLDKGWITQKYDIGGSSNAYHVGDKLTVIYDQDTLVNFTIDDTRAKLAGPLFYIIGIVLLVFDLLLLTLSLLS